MRLILFKLAPPKPGLGAIRTTWIHRVGSKTITIRGAISGGCGPYQIELMREAFPACCEGCVGIVSTERSERWKRTAFTLVSSKSRPEFRERDGVLCHHCIVRIANDGMSGITTRLDNLGCDVKVKVRFPKRGTIDNYMEKYGSKVWRDSTRSALSSIAAIKEAR